MIVDINAGAVPDILMCLLAKTVNYRIVELTEEKVPLAGGPGNSYYWIIIVVLISIASISLLTCYLFRCMEYRNRLIGLLGKKPEHISWNYWRLKETVRELETEMVDRMMEERQLSLE